MSRIRGIEAREPKDVAQVRRNGLVENTKKKNEDRASTDDVEKQQMAELVRKLPALGQHFEVVRKIGEGTFSSVYLGSLRRQAARPAEERRWFAIKHLVPTAHPHRVEHELRCLQDMGGKDNIIGVELCLRHFDTIVFVMPYIPHRKFSEYVSEMTAEELRDYLRALLIALRRVHSFGVIHRDIKPSNFLYDRENKRYLLVDFGLAQRITPAPAGAAGDTRVSVALPAAAAAPAPPPPAHSAALKRSRADEEVSPPAAKKVALDLTVGPRSNPAPAPATALAAAPTAAPAPRTAAPTPDITQPQAVLPKGGEGAAPCACWGRGGVCLQCCARAAPRACRAGTCGFRPPEVLLKCPNQDTAVDMWAVGVVVVSVLSGRYPFFRAGDDAAALAELTDLLGTAPLQRAAARLGRRLLTSSHRRGLCLRKLCARLRGAAPAPPAASAAAATPPCAQCQLPPAGCLCRDPRVPATSFVPGREVAGFPDAAFALAARLLHPDPARRISAERALHHPFLADPAC